MKKLLIIFIVLFSVQMHAIVDILVSVGIISVPMLGFALATQKVSDVYFSQKKEVEEKITEIQLEVIKLNDQSKVIDTEIHGLATQVQKIEQELQNAPSQKKAEIENKKLMLFMNLQEFENEKEKLSRKIRHLIEEAKTITQMLPQQDFESKKLLFGAYASAVQSFEMTNKSLSPNASR